jgi:HEAT repeat protein
MKLLQAPEEAVFSATADTLGAIGQDATAAMPTLIEWLQFPDRDTRHRAAQHAICMNFKSSAVPALIRSLQSDAPESQRKQSARCLCNMGRDAEAAVPALIELTHTEHSPALRIYFVDALAWTGAHSHDAISALKLLAQKDQSPDIRHQAAMRLDEISKGIL